MKPDLTAFFERLPLALLVLGSALLGFAHMLARAEWREDSPAEIVSFEQLGQDVIVETSGAVGGSSEITALRKDLNRLLKRYTEAHPDVIWLRQRIGALERGAPASGAINLEPSEGGDTESARIAPHPRRHTPEERPEISHPSEAPAVREASFYVDGRLRVPVTVKDVAGVGATRYPTTLVLPLPYGGYQDTSVFRITDAYGVDVSAQFRALDRWWARDRSIRHLQVDFQPSVEAYVVGRETTGTSLYYISDDGPASTPASALRVAQTPDHVEVVTGPLRFTVSKRAYSIFDRVWLDSNNDRAFDDDELIVEANDEAGAILLGRTDGDERHDRARGDVNVTVEQSGPLRVVIKAEAPTRYAGPDDHTHGFAVRIYAYAGKSHVKIDYQLQNSDKRPAHSGPLYFEALALNFPLLLQGEPGVRIGTGDGKFLHYPRGRGLLLAQEFQDSFSVWDDSSTRQLATGRQADGFLDIRDGTRGVAAFSRFFWETWPNGIEVSRKNMLSLQPFPRFGAQWHRNKVSPTGLYWLQDMQHVYKEALLVFHDADVPDEELRRESKRFDRPPIATLPTAWYARTRVTLDLGGAFPAEQVTREKQRAYRYAKGDFDALQRKTYRFNWANFYLIDPRRKKAPAIAGGWAHGKADYILTESPSDVALLELFAIGELNARPHWLAGYRYADDFQRIKLGDRLPYQPQTWRARGKLRVAYLEGTAPDARPRDDHHGWYHHLRESYYATANPWLKDWFQFIGEHRKAFLDRHWNLASREVGHALASAIDAFRVTGDLEIIDLAHRDITERLRKQQNRKYGFRNSKCCGQYGEAAFQAGYLARAVINFMEEVDTNSQAYVDAFQFLSGLMEWNLHFANFSYYLDARKGGAGTSHGTALTFVDPQAWYYWNTGKRAYWSQIEDYMDGGIGEGRRPFGKFKSWQGQYEARLYRWVKTRDRIDAVPPEAIQDLVLSGTGTDTVLRFSTPSDAVRYQVVWGQNPIVEGPSSASNELNWWAADALSATATANSDSNEEIHIPLNAKYAAVFSFDSANNMSAISNVVSTGEASDNQGIVEQEPSAREPRPSVHSKVARSE